MNDFLKTITDLLSLPEEEKRERGVEILDLFFQYLRDKKKTIDPQDLKEAIAFFQELKSLERLLDGEIIKGCQINDITPHELESYIENKGNFTPEEWETLIKAKEDLSLQLQQISSVFSKNKEFTPKLPAKKTHQGPEGWIKS